MENKSSVTGGGAVLSGYEQVKQGRGFFTTIFGLGFCCFINLLVFISHFLLAESLQWEQWDRAAACAGRAGESLGCCTDHGKSGLM